MRWYLFLALLACAYPVAARMYQWTNPDTGTTYFSGNPPSWYRTPAGGPRVLVYEDGKLVDDTQRQATQEKEAALRERALRELAARKEEAERSKVEEAQPAGGDETAADEGVTKEDDAIAIFRAIISEWDRRKGKAQAAGGGTQGATAPAEPATAGP